MFVIVFLEELETVISSLFWQCFIVLVQLISRFRHGSLPPFPASDKVEQVNGCHHPKHHLLQTCRAVCQVWRINSERKRWFQN